MNPLGIFFALWGFAVMVLSAVYIMYLFFGS